MIACILRIIVPVVLCLLDLQSFAQITDPHATAVHRWKSVTINEHGMDLLIRFDRPINHERSWLSLLRDGKVVETRHARLQAAPNVLFARIRIPPPGDYVVRWVMCPEKSDERYDGEFPLAVHSSSAITAENPQ